jgi:hypothetical protein
MLTRMRRAWILAAMLAAACARNVPEYVIARERVSGVPGSQTIVVLAETVALPRAKAVASDIQLRKWGGEHTLMVVCVAPPQTHAQRLTKEACDARFEYTRERGLVQTR